jgi:hypothetical protein
LFPKKEEEKEQRGISTIVEGSELTWKDACREGGGCNSNSLALIMSFPSSCESPSSRES